MSIEIRRYRTLPPLAVQIAHARRYVGKVTMEHLDKRSTLKRKIDKREVRRYRESGWRDG